MVPKNKTSSTKTKLRRTHQKLAKPVLSSCPECSEQILSHRVCPFCGFYKGNQIIEVKKTTL